LDDPVIFFEPKRRYWDKAELDPAATASLPLDRARVCVPGSDATLVAYGGTVATAMTAAKIATEEGLSLEVIDLRSLAPLDIDTIAESVDRTGRLIVVHEAPVTGGIGAEIAARITERCFYRLEAPVRRVGGFDIPYPPAKLE